MPDWKAPFHLPKLTSDEFFQMKAAYVAKYGYTVTYPGLEDFIKIGISKPITEQEQLNWIQRNEDFFSPDRFEEIRLYKENRKAMFLRMLSSPTPAIFNARASIIGSIDDAQDAISTLASIGRLAARTLPSTMVSLISGPFGWLMKAGNLLDIATTVLTPEVPKRITKRQLDTLTSLNPATRKVRWKKANILAQKGFSGGDALQLGQVTENVFGVGISLGAFMAFPLDLLSGVVRGVLGQEVEFVVKPTRIPFWHLVAKRALKALCCILTAPVNLNLTNYETDLLTVQLAAQIDSVFTERFNPVDDLINPDNVEVQAPKITNLVTREAIIELGHDPDAGVSWPCTGNEWSTYTEISNVGHENATRDFKDFNKRKVHSYQSFQASCNAVESVHYLGECATGIGQVAYDFTAINKSIHSLANADYAFPHLYNISSRLGSTIDILLKDTNKSSPAIIFADPKKVKLVQYGEVDFFNPSFQISIDRPDIDYDMSQLVNAKYYPSGDTSQNRISAKAQLSELPLSQLNVFLEYFRAHEENGTTPTTPDLLRISQERFGFDFIYSPVSSGLDETSLTEKEIP